MTELSTQQAEAFDFNVLHGDDTQIVTGRLEAVRVAKDISRDSRGRVAVERKDGRVLMMFHEGRLESFVYETRDGKTASA